MKPLKKISFKKNKNLKLTSGLQNKLEKSLVSYAYRQAPVGFVASFFCATIVFISAFYNMGKINAILWYFLFIFIIILRIILIYYYKKGNKKDISKWSSFFIISSFATGAVWGLAGIFLISIQHDSVYLTFIVLILAGITAASIPLFAGILNAAFAFLILAILPTAIHLMFMKNYLYTLLAFMMCAYLLVLIMMSIRQHNMIKKSITLQFENTSLLKKQALFIKQLEQTATHDSLTNLTNRRMFLSILKQAIKRSQRSHKMLAILFLDLDNFKNVNDQYGHHLGDRVLIEIAKKLESSIRTTDTVSRWGGDEFAIILENISEQKNVVVIVNNLINCITEIVKIDKIEIKLGISIGISLYPNDGKDVDTLLKDADTAMYYTKEQGGNSYFFISDLGAIDNSLG